MKKEFSLVIPTYNEAKNIASLCGLLEEVLTKNKIHFEIIIVDDNSPDQTWKIAEELSRKNPVIKSIRRTNEKGLGTAVTTGWSIAEGEVLGVIDGDFQHPPKLLSQMLKKILTNKDIDIVVASRNVKGGGVSKWSIVRRVISWLGTIISYFLLSETLKNINDPMSGYFILRKRVIEGKNLTPLGYKILLEVLAKGNYKKTIEIPYFFKEREEGNSKAGLRQYLVSLIHVLKLSIQTKQIYKTIRYSLILSALVIPLLFLKITGIFIAVILIIIGALISGIIISEKHKIPCIDDVEKGYYHLALEENKIQRYWHYKKFEIISKKLGDSPIIDIGSGPGVFFYFNDNISGMKINVDNSYQQLSYGKNLNPQTYYINAVSSNLPFKNDSFGTVCLIETIEHLEEYEVKKTLSEIFKIIKPNGKIIISTPNYKSIWPLIETIISIRGPVNYKSQHVTHFNTNKLTSFIKESGFKIISRESFYIISPFVSVISERISDLLLILEQKLLNKWGAILLIEAVKPRLEILNEGLDLENGKQERR